AAPVARPDPGRPRGGDRRLHPARRGAARPARPVARRGGAARRRPAAGADVVHRLGGLRPAVPQPRPGVRAMSLVHELLAWLASLCLLLGGLFILLGAIGLYRLPAAYSRMHAASKAGALGAMFLLLGAALATAGAWAPKAVLGILVLLLCSPLAAHAI